MCIFIMYVHAAHTSEGMSPTFTVSQIVQKDGTVEIRRCKVEKQPVSIIKG